MAHPFFRFLCVFSFLLSAFSAQTAVVFAASYDYIWPVGSSTAVFNEGMHTSKNGTSQNITFNASNKNALERTDRMGNHDGMDISRVGSESVSVLAAADGTVKKVGNSSTYGNYVEVGHANGQTTFYAHLASASARVGDEVSAGSTLGIMGNTGNSWGTHLHFEVRQYTSVNAFNILDPVLSIDPDTVPDSSRSYFDQAKSTAENGPSASGGGGTTSDPWFDQSGSTDSGSTDSGNTSTPDWWSTQSPTQLKYTELEAWIKQFQDGCGLAPASDYRNKLLAHIKGLRTEILQTTDVGQKNEKINKLQKCEQLMVLVNSGKVTDKGTYDKPFPWMDKTISDMLVGFLNYLLLVVLNFLYGIFQFFYALFSLFVGLAFYIPSSVAQLWQLMLNMVKVLFALGLAVLAMFVTFDYKPNEYAIKTTLPKLLVSLILVNFSYSLVLLFLTVSEFLYVNVPVWILAASRSGGLSISGGDSGAVSFADMLNIEHFFRMSTIMNANTDSVMMGTMLFTLQIIFAGAIVLWFIPVYAQMAGAMAMRILGIWVLIALAPVAFLARSFKATEKHFTRWLDLATKLAFLPVQLAFLLSFSFVFISGFVGPIRDFIGLMLVSVLHVETGATGAGVIASGTVQTIGEVIIGLMGFLLTYLDGFTQWQGSAFWEASSVYPALATAYPSEYKLANLLTFFIVLFLFKKSIDWVSSQIQEEIKKTDMPYMDKVAGFMKENGRKFMINAGVGTLKQGAKWANSTVVRGGGKFISSYKKSGDWKQALGDGAKHTIHWDKVQEMKSQKFKTFAAKNQDNPDKMVLIDSPEGQDILQTPNWSDTWTRMVDPNDSTKEYLVKKDDAQSLSSGLGSLGTTLATAASVTAANMAGMKDKDGNAYTRESFYEAAKSSAGNPFLQAAKERFRFSEKLHPADLHADVQAGVVAAKEFEKASTAEKGDIRTFLNNTATMESYSQHEAAVKELAGIQERVASGDPNAATDLAAFQARVGPDYATIDGLVGIRAGKEKVMDLALKIAKMEKQGVKMTEAGHAVIGKHRITQSRAQTKALNFGADQFEDIYKYVTAPADPAHPNGISDEHRMAMKSLYNKLERKTGSNGKQIFSLKQGETLTDIDKRLLQRLQESDVKSLSNDRRQAMLDEAMTNELLVPKDGEVLSTQAIWAFERSGAIGDEGSWQTRTLPTTRLSQMSADQREQMKKLGLLREIKERHYIEREVDLTSGLPGLRVSLSGGRLVDVSSGTSRDLTVHLGSTPYDVNRLIGPNQMLRFKPGAANVLEVNPDYYADKGHPITDSTTGLQVANGILHSIKGQLRGLDPTLAQQADQETSLVDIVSYQEHSTEGGRGTNLLRNAMALWQTGLGTLGGVSRAATTGAGRALMNENVFGTALTEMIAGGSIADALSMAAKQIQTTIRGEISTMQAAQQSQTNMMVGNVTSQFSKYLFGTDAGIQGKMAEPFMKTMFDDAAKEITSSFKKMWLDDRIKKSLEYLERAEKNDHEAQAKLYAAMSNLMENSKQITSAQQAEKVRNIINRMGAAEVQGRSLVWGNLSVSEVVGKMKEGNMLFTGSHNKDTQRIDGAIQVWEMWYKSYDSGVAEKLLEDKKFLADQKKKVDAQISHQMYVLRKRIESNPAGARTTDLVQYAFLKNLAQSIQTQFASNPKVLEPLLFFENPAVMNNVYRGGDGIPATDTNRIRAKVNNLQKMYVDALEGIVTGNDWNPAGGNPDIAIPPEFSGLGIPWARLTLNLDERKKLDRILVAAGGDISLSRLQFSDRDAIREKAIFLPT